MTQYAQPAPFSKSPTKTLYGDLMGPFQIILWKNSIQACFDAPADMYTCMLSFHHRQTRFDFLRHGGYFPYSKTHDALALVVSGFVSDSEARARAERACVVQGAHDIPALA